MSERSKYWLSCTISDPFALTAGTFLQRSEWSSVENRAGTIVPTFPIVRRVLEFHNPFQSIISKSKIKEFLHRMKNIH